MYENLHRKIYYFMDTDTGNLSYEATEPIRIGFKKKMDDLK